MPDEQIAPQPVPNSSPLPDERLSVQPGSTNSPPSDERIAARPVSINSSTGGGLWYLLLKGKEIGPFTIEELTAQIGDGSLHPEDPVRTEHGTWAPANSFPTLAEHFADRGIGKSQLHGEGERTASGIWGGWLVLPTVFLLLNPFQICCCMSASLGTETGVHADSFFNLGLLLYWCLVVIAFFLEKRWAPAHVIAFLLAGIVASLVWNPVVDLPFNYPQVLVRAVMAAIWIPYFLLSRRVKATFVR
jgi:hypothetical protein